MQISFEPPRQQRRRRDTDTWAKAGRGTLLWLVGLPALAVAIGFAMSPHKQVGVDAYRNTVDMYHNGYEAAPLLHQQWERNYNDRFKQPAPLAQGTQVTLDNRRREGATGIRGQVAATATTRRPHWVRQ